MNNTIRDRSLFAAAACLAMISIIWFCSTRPSSRNHSIPAWEQTDAVTTNPVHDTAEPVFPAPEAPEEGFTDIMGYTGYAVTEAGISDWYLRTYYTIQGGGPMKIAETFGYGKPQDYVVDLEGDGVTELVANVTFGGDGARRAYVYQRRGNDVYLGDPSPDGLPNFNNWGANAYWSEYDPLEQVFRIHYSQKNSDEYGLLETRDLSRFQFSRFTP